MWCYFGSWDYSTLNIHLYLIADVDVGQCVVICLTLYISSVFAEPEQLCFLEEIMKPKSNHLNRLVRLCL